MAVFRESIVINLYFRQFTNYTKKESDLKTEMWLMSSEKALFPF